MTTDMEILQKMDGLSPDLKREVLDFIEFVVRKRQKAKPVKRTPVFGCAKGQFQMADDFDAPLEDFKEYME
ncbi:hypothetical protein Barb7_00391 [Bacteroidales bacterium Barb7]|nr:hypothetical protein Barb7_00391 [Bacteroidales bacterium Barb7]